MKFVDYERARDGDKNLQGANLTDANLFGAHLLGANLRDVKGLYAKDL